MGMFLFFVAAIMITLCVSTQAGAVFFFGGGLVVIVAIIFSAHKMDRRDQWNESHKNWPWK